MFSLSHWVAWRHFSMPLISWHGRATLLSAVRAVSKFRIQHWGGSACHPIPLVAYDGWLCLSLIFWQRRSLAAPLFMWQDGAKFQIPNSATF